MKKTVRLIIITILFGLMLGTLTGCSDGEDYTCGYCGRKMGHYYSYIGGKYTCHACTKILRGN